jgi:predicted GTPase
MADVVVVNKVDTADPADVEAVVAEVRRLVPDAPIIRAASPVTLQGDGDLAGQRVLVVEDGPTLTHGGMPFGAGTVAAQAAGAAEIVDPRPYAVGSIATTYTTYPSTGAVLPAMGYGAAQLADLEATLRAAPVDVVVSGTPMDLGRLLDPGHPMRRATYVLEEIGTPTLAEALAPLIARARA